MSIDTESPGTFTRMDQSTAEQWAVIGQETVRNQPRVAERVLGLLRSLDEITDGFSTDQLTHCLQTATLAERAGADNEVVVAALCHDVGKAISQNQEGTHTQLGMEIAKKYNEDPIVINAIGSHHEDIPADNLISLLVSAADAISGSRPGASVSEAKPTPSSVARGASPPGRPATGPSGQAARPRPRRAAGAVRPHAWRARSALSRAAGRRPTRLRSRRVAERS